MKKIVALVMLCFACVACNTDSQTSETSSVEENVGSAEQELTCSMNDRCAPCPDCAPIASMCFNIESNSTPYICRPGDSLPHGKSCFLAGDVSIYEWCCCDTGSCVPR